MSFETTTVDKMLKTIDTTVEELAGSLIICSMKRFVGMRRLFADFILND